VQGTERLVDQFTVSGRAFEVEQRLLKLLK